MNRTHRVSRIMLLASAACLAPLAPAFAQDASAPMPPDAAPQEAAQGEGGATGLGEIVVTATRRAESSQRVAISLQALSPDKLEQRQVSNFSDYATMLPSVSYASLGPGRTDLFFRGIAVDGGQLSTAGTYLDDIPLTTAGRMPEIHVYDVSRVEALSGPQGTLFGSSSLSGTLRIITNKPDPSAFAAGYDVELNKFGKGGVGHQEEGFVNLPVADGVALRVVGFYSRTGGYIDNLPASHTYGLGDYLMDADGNYLDRSGRSILPDGNGNYTVNGQVLTDASGTPLTQLPASILQEDKSTNYTTRNAKVAKDNYNPVTEYGGRVALSVEAAPDWTILPQFVYQYLDAKGGFNYDPRVGDLAVHDFHETYNKDGWWQAALTVTGKIADFDVVSSTGYFRRRVKNANDYTYYTIHYDDMGQQYGGYESYLQFRDPAGNLIDPTQQYYGNNTYSKFTQEVRVSVPKSWPFSLTFGGFYQWQKNEFNEDYYIPGLSQATNIDGGTSYLRRDAFYLTEVDRLYKDYALFAEGSYEIVPRVKLTGGIRLFRAENESRGWEGVAALARDNGCAVPLTGPRLSCDNVTVPNPYKESGETHKLGVAFQVTPDKMVYFTYSTGFRPGGSNTIAPDNPYKADELSNFEAGFKTSWGPNFRFNLSAYYEKWKGIQYYVVPAGYQGNGLTLNAGDGRVYGVEADFDLRFGGLTLSGSGAYNDAALASDFCALSAPDSTTQFASCAGEPDKIAAAKGTRLPRQPKFKAQASARYTFDVGALKSFVQGVVLHQSSSTSNLDAFKNSLLGNTPGFTSFDFSAGFSKDNWNLEAFIQNAFDRRGILSRNTFCAIEYCSGSSRSLPITPRFFGVRFGQTF
ncbi:TonB-dependent receptor [Novosphingobium cyanobacteriorum]|uniref:TonB-dependent receptor n=1 Tax=Novosphingobium cyanobacteriorum TaxID=3024215 RepID=A0ABT6CLC7_9SPHN|nr:TonB-dependent receptor [Novosphingobium cyanobacteriorum]MDF8334719.1 TonB-dependent receptor [Novosphingobium cyanobacteriorum]